MGILTVKVYGNHGEMTVNYMTGAVMHRYPRACYPEINRFDVAEAKATFGPLFYPGCRFDVVLLADDYDPDPWPSRRAWLDVRLSSTPLPPLAAAIAAALPPSAPAVVVRTNHQLGTTLMNITLTKTDAGFDLAHPQLPAPLRLSSEDAKNLAIALASDEVATPAFKTDKSVWASQERLPVGLWVLEDGTIQIWLAGQAETLTVDQCRELAAIILLGDATYKIGDELETKQDLNLYDAADTSFADPVPPAEALANKGSIGTVTSIELRGGKPAYRLQIGKQFTLPVHEGGVQVPPPIINYRVAQDGVRYSERSVIVSARTPHDAKQQAAALFQSMGKRAGWVENDHVVEGINTIEEASADEDLAQSEGWAMSPTGKNILAVVDGPFASDRDAFQFVLAKSFTGSAPHVRAVKATLGV
jgi:hypothetical protein